MSTATKNSLSVESAEAQKAFVEHIAELRSRAFWIAIAFVVFSSLAYTFRQPLIDLILSPIGSQQLVYLTPGGGFSFIFQIIMYAGAVVTSPLIIFHLYRFIQPALPPRAQKNSFRVIIASVLLMMGGVSFGYFVAIPSALVFLTTFAGDFVSPNLTADSYLGFVMAYLAGLGILFQLPLFLIIWNWINPLPPGGLLNSQRYVIAFAFIAAAIITPTPDVVNQGLVAAPIVGVYQLGVISVFIINRRARKQAKKAALSARKARRASDVEKTQPLEEKPQSVSTPKPVLAAAATQAKMRPVMDITGPKGTAGRAQHRPRTHNHAQTSLAASKGAPTLAPRPQLPRRSAMDGFVSNTQPVRVRPPQASLPPRRSAQMSASRPAMRRSTSRSSLTAYTQRSGVVPSQVSSPRAVGLDGFSMNR